MSEKRSIFEEVDADEVNTSEPNDRIGIARSKNFNKPLKIWLTLLFVLVALMIVVGGLTRLTDSGLSITEWKPITGALPPFNMEMWQSEFAKYKTIPEFQIQNKSMTLLEFKTIYWWEWGHRQLGRVVGLVWLIGFVWLVVGKKMSGIWTTRSLIIGGLGGLQGAIGWWMVSSGLSGRMVDVASYRLAVHLGIAFLIITLITWYLLQANISDQERIRSRREREKNLIPITNILLGFIFLQIIVGALVAGIDAGRGYTDWPLMNGEFLPTESFSYTPILSNFTENPALVQFNHRIIGYLTVLYTIFVWWRCRSSSFDATKRRSNLVLLIVFLQMIMGIATVIYAAPLGWAIVHQFGAILIIVFVQSLRSQISFPKKQLVQL